MTDEAVISPPVVKVTAGGESLEITPVRVKQLVAFGRAIKPAIPAVIKTFDASDAASEGDQATLIVGLVADHGDEIQQAVAIATGKGTAWVGDLNMADFIRLIGAVLQVNSDFFRNAILVEVANLRKPAEMAKLPGQ